MFKRIKLFCGNYLRIRILSGDMTAQTDPQKLPDALVEILDDLNVSTLRSVRTYLDQRIDDLRPNHSRECRTEIIDALVQIGSHRTKCRDVEVVEDLDKRIGEVLTVRLRGHIR